MAPVALLSKYPAEFLQGFGQVFSGEMGPPRPSSLGLTASHILFAGHRGFRQIPEKIDDHQATCSPWHCKGESHSFPTASCSAASASRFYALRLCAFAPLRLCVFAFERGRLQRRVAEAQRRRAELATDVYPCNASIGSRAEGIQGIASLSPRLGSDGPFGRNDGGFDTHSVQRKRYG